MCQLRRWPDFVAAARARARRRTPRPSPGVNPLILVSSSYRLTTCSATCLRQRSTRPTVSTEPQETSRAVDDQSGVMSRWDEYVDAGAGAVGLPSLGFEPTTSGGAVYSIEKDEVSSHSWDVEHCPPRTESYPVWPAWAELTAVNR